MKNPDFFSRIAKHLGAAVCLGLASSALIALQPANAADCASATDWVGAGTSVSPFLIDTAARAQGMALEGASSVGKHYRITANIDLGGCDLRSQAVAFQGTVNGDGFAISNFRLTNAPLEPAGFFTRTVGASLSNLKIDGAIIQSSTSQVGALVGRADSTQFSNITVSNSTVSGTLYVGGIAGAAWGGPAVALNGLKVIQSTINSTLGAVGGLLGATSGSYTSLANSGAFNVEILVERNVAAYYVGGLIGATQPGLGSVQSSGFRGRISIDAPSVQHAGLLIGYADNTSPVAVTSSYARGSMQLPATATEVAGFIGTVANNFSVQAANVTGSYLEAKFVRYSDNSTQVPVYAFAQVANFTNAFYSSSTHSSWLQTVNGPTPTAKTSAELRTLATFPSGAFPVATDTTAVNSGLASEAWFRPGADDGYLFLAHEYKGSDMTPCAFGRYSWNGFDDCILAEPGKFVAFSGRTYQDTCPAGTFSPSTGRTDCIPAPAGSYVALPGQVASISCPAGSFQGQTGQMVCLHANIGFYVPDLGSAVELPCPAGTTTTTTGQSACSPIASTSYSGPLVSGPATGVPGGQVTLNGSGLASVTKVSVEGVDCKVDAVSDSSITLTIPSTITTGTKDLVITSPSGSLTVQGALIVKGASSLPAANSSIKRVGDKARLAVGNAVGVGKIQFLVNGKEVAWVKAIDGSNPKLRNGQYFVRTTKLAAGKNLVEIKVAGKSVAKSTLTK